jgi:hypothetical protein
VTFEQWWASNAASFNSMRTWTEVKDAARALWEDARRSQAGTKTEFRIVIKTESGKKFALRDDGYRVYARQQVCDPETVVFEYKHSEHADAYEIVHALLQQIPNS